MRRPELESGLQRAAALIRKSFKHPPDLAELAAVAGFSQFHFHRQFRERFRETPVQMCMRLRIELAKRLIREGLLPFGKIASQCGFCHPTRFSIAFKRATGATPTEWLNDLAAQSRGPRALNGRWHPLGPQSSTLRKRICELYAQDKSTKQIAEQLGISRSSAYRARPRPRAHKTPVEPLRAARRTSQLTAEISKRIKSYIAANPNATRKQVRAALGLTVSVQTIGDWLWKLRQHGGGAGTLHL